jgi:hypothetical protein
MVFPSIIHAADPATATGVWVVVKNAGVRFVPATDAVRVLLTGRGAVVNGMIPQVQTWLVVPRAMYPGDSVAIPAKLSDMSPASWDVEPGRLVNVKWNATYSAYVDPVNTVRESSEANNYCKVESPAGERACLTQP